MAQSILRNVVYINQVPELMKKQRHISRSSFVKCGRFICTDKKSGIKTTGIIFPTGKVYIGDDVWRLSNRADCCEYPFRGYGSLKIAAADYEIRKAETTFPEYAEKMKEGGVRHVHEQFPLS